MDMLVTTMTQLNSIFLSYAGVDRETAAKVVVGLRQAGVNIVWDLDHIKWGDNWQDRLQEELSRCDGYVILIGESGIRRWVKAELQFALRRYTEDDDLAIFPLLLPGVTPEDLPPFLSLAQARTLPDPPADSDFKKLAVELRTAVVGTATPSKPDWSIEPYPGLESFEEGDARFFYGREVETAELLGKLGERPGAPYTRWLQVEGASGVGKSSLLLAGLIPAVKRGWIEKERPKKRGKWFVAAMRPGTNPLMSLRVSLRKILPEIEKRIDAISDTSVDSTVLTFILRSATNDGENAQIMLVVDQLEELFTMAEERARSRFDQLVAHALSDPDCPLYLVTSIRSDFTVQFATLPQLKRVLNERAARYILAPIGETGLRNAVQSPARIAGLHFTEGLPARIVKDGLEAGEGALPLVANVLRLLWDRARARGRGVLHVDDYDDLRGVAGALASSADRVLSTFDKRECEAARKILLALVNPGRDEQPETRKRISRQEALKAAEDPDVAIRVLNRLSGLRDKSNEGPLGPRLVVVRDGDNATVDLAHELLLRTDHRRKPYWTKLKEWVSEYREQLKLRDQLRARAENWVNAGRPTHGGYLVSGKELKELSVVASTISIETNFLVASRRWQKISRSLLFAIIPLVTIITFVTWVLSDAGRRYQFGYELGHFDLVEPEMVFVGAGVLEIKENGIDGFQTNRVLSTRTLAVDPFEIGKYEITFEQYDQYATLVRGKLPHDEGWGRGKRPVINVSWDDANGYAEWLSKESGRKYRLPTEEEWEYASRGGTTTIYWWGDELLLERAQCEDCRARSSDKGKTMPVGTLEPNEFGLYDTAGNVMEWVADCYEDVLISSRESKIISSKSRGKSCNNHVLRGGSWFNTRMAVESSYRLEGKSGRSDTVGFRLVREVIK